MKRFLINAKSFSGIAGIIETLFTISSKVQIIKIDASDSSNTNLPRFDSASPNVILLDNIDKASDALLQNVKKYCDEDRPIIAIHYHPSHYWPKNNLWESVRNRFHVIDLKTDKIRL